MPSKTSLEAPSDAHPPLGTLIDDDTLELVEILGIGGYGVVYRAVETRSPCPKSYAVKCLVHSKLHQNSRQRQTHIREIALHQISSAHPNVVTLHRVIEHYHLTYIIMDYASDGDLFSQILHKCRYLGDDFLIKHIFLQLLDAVEYCHSLGIYHRDLKPENILCFDGGLRIAITDFGLATTDKMSQEFRTGSIYHMSPECQGGEFAPSGSYSPLFNDIWSLAIILLNLATGRNPWKSASASDPTFQAYLHDPAGFLPTVLPISRELNAILIRMLEIDWKDRIRLPELRQEIEDLNTFYSEGVIFEGSMARCPWEAGMDIDSDSNKDNSPMTHSHPEDLKSHWSKDSSLMFANQSMAEEGSYREQWTDHSSSGATWALESPISSHSSRNLGSSDVLERPRTPQSTRSLASPCYSDSMSSSPTTPNSMDLKFGGKAKLPPKTLTIDTKCRQSRYFDARMESLSTGSSMMMTAMEYDQYSSSFFLASPASQSKASIVMPSSIDLGADTMEDKEMSSPSIWAYSMADMSSPSVYATTRNSMRISVLTNDMSFEAIPSTLPSDTIVWPEFRTQPKPQQSQHSSSIFAQMTDPLPPPRSSTSPIPSKKSPEGKLKSSSIFKPIKFFPRSPPFSSLSPKASLSQAEQHPPGPFPPLAFDQTPPLPLVQTWAELPSSRTTTSVPLVSQSRDCRRNAHMRSHRHWFLPGKLFTSAGAS